jgi:hypothetical protein
VLHVTNGDCAVKNLEDAGMEGDIMPWRDVLHEGPVPGGLDAAGLRAVRAEFLAGNGWGDAAALEALMAARDERLAAALGHEPVILWFEHDLFDQLQLIQVLDALGDRPGPPVALVCEPEYLGMMAPQRASELFSLRNPVTRRHVAEASAAWAAFRSSDPRKIQSVKNAALAFLDAALRRHLQEFPWTSDGLSLLERRVLQALQGGPLAFPQLFRAVEEDPAFLGDAVLEWHLHRMGQERLVEKRGNEWRLSGKSRSRRVPRWLGGYEVKDASLRWDPASGRLVG